MNKDILISSEFTEPSLTIKKCRLSSLLGVWLLANAEVVAYHKNSKIWDTSNNCHNCPKNRKVDVALH